MFSLSVIVSYNTDHTTMEVMMFYVILRIDDALARRVRIRVRFLCLLKVEC
jgi:hypothetical protein